MYSSGGSSANRRLAETIGNLAAPSFSAFSTLAGSGMEILFMMVAFQKRKFQQNFRVRAFSFLDWVTPPRRLFPLGATGISWLARTRGAG